MRVCSSTCMHLRSLSFQSLFYFLIHPACVDRQKPVGMGKHRINIEKIEDKARRHIAFSKRRKGLFKKAAHLASLGCGVAAVVISSSDNTFAFAQPDLDSVLDRYLDAGRDRQLALIPHAEAVPGPEEKEEEEEEVAGDGLEDDQTTAAAMSPAEDDGFWSDEEEEEEEEDAEEAENMQQWWKQPMEGLEKEELEVFEGALKNLRAMAMESWKELVVKEPLSLYPIWDSRSQTTAAATTTTTTSSSLSSTSTSAKPPPGLPDELDLDLKL